MKKLQMLAGVLLLVAMLPTANGQITGQISGTLADPAGAIIVGATVSLTHDLSQQIRTFTTDSNGSFVFTGLASTAFGLCRLDSKPTIRKLSRSARRNVSICTRSSFPWAR